MFVNFCPSIEHANPRFRIPNYTLQFQLASWVGEHPNVWTVLILRKVLPPRKLTHHPVKIGQNPKGHVIFPRIFRAICQFWTRGYPIFWRHLLNHLGIGWGPNPVIKGRSPIAIGGSNFARFSSSWDHTYGWDIANFRFFLEDVYRLQFIVSSEWLNLTNQIHGRSWYSKVFEVKMESWSHPVVKQNGLDFRL